MRRVSPQLSLIAAIHSQSASSCHVLGLEVDPVGDRVVVDHDRLLRGIGHGAHIGHGFARVGHVDHRRHHHVAVDAERVAAVDESQRLAGAGLGDVGQHRHAPGTGGERNPGDLEFFLQRQRAGLAQRAAGDQAMDAIADLEVDVPCRAFGVDALIGMELGGDRGVDALPAGIFHGWFLGMTARFRQLAGCPANPVCRQYIECDNAITQTHGSALRYGARC